MTMHRRRLLWQLYPSYLLITLLSLIVVTWYASEYLRGFYYDWTAQGLLARAHLIEGDVAGLFKLGNPTPLDALCKERGQKAATRITVIAASGKVLGDSEEDPAKMDNHADRPEVMAALAGGMGKFVRYSHTLHENMMYVAIPFPEGEKIVGVVRTAVPVTSIDRTLRQVYLHISAGGLIVTAVIAMLSLVISRRISRPIEELKRGAEQFARGDLSHKLLVPDSQEIGGLANAMNQMAAQLDDRILTVAKQRNEMEAVLSSMVEGVIAVDSEERVININRAAAQLIGVDPSEAKRRSIQEVVRNTQLQQFVARTLARHESVEGEIVLENGEERFLQAHGTVLRDPQGRAIGALVVLNDVTRLRQLENLRREFVANVSHEIKTPITSIKGFVETLLDGAMNDPKDARRFLGIVLKHADRLNAIIEDLLSLSRFEEEGEETAVDLEDGPIKDVLNAAIQSCKVNADAKNMKIGLSCADDLRAKIKAPLLEQAVVNLLDNAIKYSDPGGSVEVGASRTNGEIGIRVCDHGCGIEKEHLPRLFERFYRVDKARSRKMGGTGLGLAIVKHIVQAHGGRVTVESTPGKGSAFTIYVPVA
jgi:two-component system phosphate regulon sensor histidine kinase PhoR